MFRKRSNCFRLIAVADPYGVFDVTVDRLPDIRLRARNLPEAMAAVRSEVARHTGMPVSRIELTLDVRSHNTPAEVARRSKSRGRAKARHVA